MTIDATKSPTPVWQRRIVAALLAVLLAVVGYMVWTKDLHHSPAASAPPAPVAHSAPAPRAASAPSTPGTTVPGGIPVSSRDPFGN